MKRVIGIGGIFFKSKDPKALADWYKKHLGFPTEDWNGAIFKWPTMAEENKDAFTLWSPFAADTTYFQPSQKDIMINLVVSDIHALMPVLASEGVTIAGDIQDTEYGKFAWIMDPEENKIELWEPPRRGA